MKQLIERIKNEPVVVVDLVKAVLLLLVAFGIVISSAQSAAILGVVWAALTLFTRQSVTPTRKAQTARLNPPQG